MWFECVLLVCVYECVCEVLECVSVFVCVYVVCMHACLSFLTTKAPFLCGTDSSH